MVHLIMCKEAMLSAHHSGKVVKTVDSYVRINMDVYYVFIILKTKLCGCCEAKRVPED